MDKTCVSQGEDRRLVKECLEGSEGAWREFYSRFIGLMRSVARKYAKNNPQDVEDVTQSAFVSLTTALRNYDESQSLPRFVCLITERVVIDEYRKLKASKRAGETESLDRTDSRAEGPHVATLSDDLQDSRIEKAEQSHRLRVAVRALDPKCRELITMRYLEELSFNEIAESVGVSENTVTVQTRRCLEALRRRFKETGRGGARS